MLAKYNSWLLALEPFGLTKNEHIKEQFKAEGRQVYDFTLGDPKEPTPEFIRQALCDGLEKISQYPQNIGSPELRSACASWVKRRTGVELNPQTQVLSSNGSKEAIFHIHQLFLNSASDRRIVVFPEPGYPTYKSGTVLAGGIPYALPLKPEKKYIFDPNDIPNELTKQIAAIWINYPNNPTGACISYKKMEEIYAWARGHDILLLSDECYLDMNFEDSDRPHSFLEIAAADEFKNVVCFFSLSKRSGMTGYRSGFIAGQKEILSLYAKYRLNVGLGTPQFIQNAACAAWNDDAHPVERSHIFAQKRALADKFFLHNKIQVLPSSATFYVWGEVPARYSSGKEFAKTLLQQTGIMITSGEVFGPSCTRFFRLSLVPTLSDMELCLNLWQSQINLGNL